MKFWKIYFVLFFVYGFSAFAESQGGTSKSILFRNRTISVEPQTMELPFEDVQFRDVDSVQTWVIQFENPITERLKLRLFSYRIQALRYIPDDALLVRGSLGQIRKFFQRKGYQNKLLKVLKYDASLKLSPNLGVFSVLNADQRISVLVKTFSQSDALSLEKKMVKLRWSFLKRTDAFFEIVGDRQSLFQMAQNPEVEFVQESVFFTPMYMSLGDSSDPALSQDGDYTDLTGMESGTQIMNFEKAWSLGYSGAGEIVAMADTGLDSGNEQAIHSDFSLAVLRGQAVGLFSKSWADPMGHGTHVAGSILGRGVASHGLLKGGAYGAKMVAQGMWSPMLENLSVPSKMGELFKKAYDEGARVHSNSWGSPKNLGEYDSFSSQTDEYIYQNGDLLVLFAAGNSGVDLNKDGRIDPGSVSSPGTSKNVLTVGASENEVSTGGIQVPSGKLRQGKDNWGTEPIASDLISNHRDGLAMFSSRGPTVDGRIKPEVVAPGTNILSVKSQEPGSSPLWGNYNRDYVWAGGTSMATPLTAGAVAVAREYLIKKWGGVPSAALLKAYLLHHAVDMYPGQFGIRAQGQEILTRRPNSDEGYGRVDMASMITSPLGFVQDKANVELTLIDEKQGVEQGGERAYSFDLKKAGIVANLVWTDAPATPSAGKSLVNDLDLRIVDEHGATIKASSDHTNNHEIIEIKDLPPGKYQLIVNGYKIPLGKNGRQPFALVYNSSTPQ